MAKSESGRAHLPGIPDESALSRELEDVIVDTRPLALVLLSRSVRPFLLLLGVAVFLILAQASPPSGLSVTAQRSLAVFALCVIYWVTGALPLMVTSLLALVLLGISGVMPVKNAFALFGNEAIFFVLAAFMLAAAVSHRGLGRRVALMVFARFGNSPRGLLASVFLLGAMMSFVIPEHAVAAMLFPIVLDLVESMELEPGYSGYATALFLAMAWGVNIGGIATLLGGARGPLALGILTEATGQTISFLKWSLATMPLVVLLSIVGFVVLEIFFGSNTVAIEKSSAEIRKRRNQIGRMSFQEKAVAIVLLVTLGAWLFGSRELGLANIAILAVVALFALNLLSWSEVEDYVNWGIILMYGGAIALGSALQRTGAAGFIARATLGSTSSSIVMLAIISLTAELLGEALSHTAVVAALVPVGLGLAHRFGVDPRAITLAITIPAGLTFIMPVGTPANALAHSGGYLRTRELVVPGLILIACAWLGLNLMVHFYWPLIGF